MIVESHQAEMRQPRRYRTRRSAREARRRYYARLVKRYRAAGLTTRGTPRLRRSHDFGRCRGKERKVAWMRLFRKGLVARGLTTKGTPRMNRDRHGLVAELAGLRGIERRRKYQRLWARKRAERFHEQGLTRQGRVRERRLYTVASAAERRWAALKAGMVLPTRDLLGPKDRYELGNMAASRDARPHQRNVEAL